MKRKYKATLMIAGLLGLLWAIDKAEGADFNADFDNVEVVKIYDGDTITVTIPDIPPVFGNRLGIRISGIDTPEIRGKCAREKYLAQTARLEVKHIIELNGNKVDLKNCERGKYFRLVCDVYAQSNIAEDMLHKNLAYPYDGGTKENPWCD